MHYLIGTRLTRLTLITRLTLLILTAQPIAGMESRCSSAIRIVLLYATAQVVYDATYLLCTGNGLC